MKNLIIKFNKVNPVVIAILIFIILAAICFITRKMGQMGCDMGEYINNPLRIINGDLPYRDFWLLFSPGEVYFPALIYKIFGINGDTVKTISILFSCSIVVFAFYLCKMLVKNNFESFIFSFVFFFTSIISTYVGPDYIHLYLLFLIISAMFLVKYFIEEKLICIFLSGFAIGCSFFFRIYEVGAALAAFGISILFYLIYSRKSIKFSLKLIGFYILGIVIIPLITAVAFNNILPILYREIFTESVKNGTSMNLPYFHEVMLIIGSIKDDFVNIAHSKGSYYFIRLFFHILNLGFKGFAYIFPFMIIILFIYYIATKPKKKDLYIALTLFMWSAISLAKGFGRADVAHVSPSITPGIFFLLFVFKTQLQAFNVGQFANKFINKFYVLTIILMLLPLFFTFGYYFQFKIPPSKIVRTSHGTAVFNTVKEADEFRYVRNYIEKNTTSVDYIFVTPWSAPPVYTLTARKDPTYFDSMNDLVVRPSLEKQIKLCNNLVSHNTKVIVDGPDWNYDNKPEQYFSVACAYMQNFIATHYKCIFKGDFYYIYVPN